MKDIQKDHLLILTCAYGKNSDNSFIIAGKVLKSFSSKNTLKNFLKDFPSHRGHYFNAVVYSRWLINRGFIEAYKHTSLMLGVEEKPFIHTVCGDL